MPVSKPQKPLTLTKNKPKKRVEQEKTNKRNQEVRGLEEGNKKIKKKWGWLAVGGVGTAGLLGALYLRRKQAEKAKKTQKKKSKIEESSSILEEKSEAPKVPEKSKEEACVTSALNQGFDLEHYIVRYDRCMEDWQGEGYVPAFLGPKLQVKTKKTCEFLEKGKEISGSNKIVVELKGKQEGLVLKTFFEDTAFAKEVMAHRAILDANPRIGPEVHEIFYCDVELPFHVLEEKLDETLLERIEKEPKPLKRVEFVEPFLKAMWALRKALRHRDYLYLNWTAPNLMTKDDGWRLVGFSNALPWFLDIWRRDMNDTLYDYPGDYLVDVQKFLDEIVKPLVFNPAEDKFWNEWTVSQRDLAVGMGLGVQTAAGAVSRAVRHLDPFKDLSFTKEELDVLYESAGESSRELVENLQKREKKLVALEIGQEEKGLAKQPERELLIQTIDGIEDKLLAWALAKISSSSS